MDDIKECKGQEKNEINSISFSINKTRKISDIESSQSDFSSKKDSILNVILNNSKLEGEEKEIKKIIAQFLEIKNIIEGSSGSSSSGSGFNESKNNNEKLGKNDTIFDDFEII